MPQATIKERSLLSPPYKRHRPEQTLLYHIIVRHYPAFKDVMTAQGKDLPLQVQQQFADLQHLQAKGALPQPPYLLPATRAPPTLDCFA
jgi:hypothetical protein